MCAWTGTVVPVKLINYLNGFQYVSLGSRVSGILLCAQNGNLLQDFHGEESVDVAAIRFANLLLGRVGKDTKKKNIYIVSMCEIFVSVYVGMGKTLDD